MHEHSGTGVLGREKLSQLVNLLLVTVDRGVDQSKGAGGIAEFHDLGIPVRRVGRYEKSVVLSVCIESRFVLVLREHF